MALDLGTIAVKLSANIQDLKTNLAGATGSIKAFATTNQAAIRGLGIGFTALGAAIIGAVAISVREAAKFEAAIKNAASVTGYAGDELKEAEQKMISLARTLGKETVFSAQEAADAMYDLASKGFEPAKMSIEELKPILDLAAATQADLTIATETVTATIRAFGLETTDAQRVADVFTMTIGKSAATIQKLQDSMSYVAPVAATAGISLEETAAALGRIYDLGFPASMAGTALRRAIIELLEPTGKLQEALDRVGMKIEDINLEADGFTGTLAKLRDAGISAEEMVGIFGQRAGPVIARLVDMSASGKSALDSINELRDALSNAGGEAERVAGVQLQSFNGAMKLLTSKINDLQITIGNVFLPTLTKLTNQFSDVLERVGQWIEKNPELTNKIVMIVTAIGGLSLALGALGLAFSPVINFISGMGQALLALVGKMASAALGVQSFATAMQASTLGMKASAVLMAGGYMAAIVALIAILGKLAWAYMDMKNAMAQAEAAQKEVLNIITLNVNNNLKAIDALSKKYIGMNADEAEHLKRITESMIALGKKAEYLKRNGELTDFMKQKLSEELLELTKERNELEKSLEVRGALTTEMYEEQAAAEELAETKAKEAEANRQVNSATYDLMTQLRALNAELANGGLASEQYQSRFLALRDQFVGILGDADEVLKKMNELEESDPNIEAKFKVFGMEEYEDVAERIKRINQDIVLNSLEGDARKIQSAKFELQNYLDNIQKKLDAEEAFHKKKLIDLEAALQAEIALLAKSYDLEVEAQRVLYEKKKLQTEEYFKKNVEIENTRLQKMKDLYKEEADAFKIKTQQVLDSINKKDEAVESSADKAVQDLKKEGSEVDALKSKYDTLSASASRGSTYFGGGPKVVTVGSIQEALAQPFNLGQITQVKSGYQAGTHYVPTTGMYKLHKGERVINSEENRNGQSSSGVVIANFISEDLLTQFMADNPNAILNIVGNDIVAYGKTRKLIRGVVQNG